MQYGIPASLVASLLLTGCSLLPNWSEKNTTHSQQPIGELKVPVGLSAAKKPSDFDIPNVVIEQSAHAELKSPMQVLALSTNSRVDEEEQEARIWFERTEFTGDLVPHLQQTLKAFAAEKGIELTQKDADGLVFETGWVVSTGEEGSLWWKEQVAKSQSRFLVVLAPKSHGRSVSVRSQLLEHTSLASEQAPLSPIAQKREEVYFLNRFIDQVATLEIAHINLKKSQLVKVNLTTGFDDDGNPAMLTSQSLTHSWGQLEQLFEQHGFSVTDLNQTTHTFYLNYTKPAGGFWSSLWGSDDTQELPLVDGDYQLVLAKNQLGTVLTWKDKEGKVLAAETVNSLQQALVPLIRKAGLEL